MDEREQEIRGEEARSVLTSEIYKEAWLALREKLVRQLELSADLPTEQRMRLVDLLIAHAKAKTYMEQVLVTGTFAAQEQERKRTLSERIFRR